MPALAPHTPSARPRRSGGKPLTAPASAAGLTRPAPAPCSTRVAASAPMLEDNAPAAAPVANRPRPSSASAERQGGQRAMPPGSSVTAYAAK